MTTTRNLDTVVDALEEATPTNSEKAYGEKLEEDKKEKDITKEGTQWNKKSNIARELMLAIVFGFLAFLDSKLIAFSAITLAKIVFLLGVSFMALGFLELLNFVTVVRKALETKNATFWNRVFSAISPKILSPLAAAVGCFLAGSAKLIHFTIPIPYLVPAFFAAAFTLATISAGKALYDACIAKKGRIPALITLGMNLLCLGVVITTLLLPAISATILPMGPGMILALLISAGVSRFFPVAKNMKDLAKSSTSSADSLQKQENVATLRPQEGDYTTDVTYQRTLADMRRSRNSDALASAAASSSSSSNSSTSTASSTISSSSVVSVPPPVLSSSLSSFFAAPPPVTSTAATPTPPAGAEVSVLPTAPAK